MKKSSARIEALGWLDQLNSELGLVRAKNSFQDLEEAVEKIQTTLFEVGADLANQPDVEAGAARISEEDVRFLEELIDKATTESGGVNKFILPAGSELACQTHRARSTCRTAERRMVALFQIEHGNPLLIVYLNRLSDLLFAMARVANKRVGIPDELWTPRDQFSKRTPRS